jgi:alpha-tubulin suppressor-like RCC1 family protein
LSVKHDGSLYAWGENDYGQLGNGTTTDKDFPIRIGSDSDWTSISAGDYHSLALKQNGSLYSWGRNNESQLGDGSARVNSPVFIMSGF